MAEIIRPHKSRPELQDIHHLHIWSIFWHITALSAPIDIEPEYRLRRDEIIGTLEQLLDHDYHITHTTMQGECSSCLTGPIIQQLKHRPRKASDDYNHYSH